MTKVKYDGTTLIRESLKIRLFTKKSVISALNSQTTKIQEFFDSLQYYCFVLDEFFFFADGEGFLAGLDVF